MAATVAAAAAATAAAADQRTTWWVAPHGTAQACAPLRPCSLQTAQQQVRAATAGMSSDLTVRLLSGTYRLADTWALTEADSGENGHRVIYEAAPGARPVISGGERVANWRRVPGSDGLWRADVGTLETRLLYVDGARARRSVLTPGLPGTVTRTATGFHTTSTAPQAWTSPTDVELVWHGRSGGIFDFAEGRCRVTAVSGDANGSDVAVAQPCFDLALAVYGSNVPGGGQAMRTPSWAENDVSFLADDTRPGRWALQRSAGGNAIVYRPRAGQSPRHVETIAGRLETLVRIAGGDEPAHDITLRGLRFSETSWRGADTGAGYPNVFADGYAAGPNAGSDPADQAFVAGAVELRATERVSVEDSRFERLGTIGLRADDGVRDARIEGNVFRDLSAGGVLLGRLGPTLAGVASGNTIAGNVIENTGAEYGAAPGIMLNLASETTVARNHIASTAYTGVIVAGSTGGVDDTHGNHVIGNVVEDVLQRSGDGGGIYGVQSHGTSLEDGLLHEGNVVRNPREGLTSFGLYTDLVSTYTTLRSNVSYGFRASLGGCNLPSTDWVFADGNYLQTAAWLGSPVWFPCGGPLNNVTIQNTTLIDEPTPEAACAANAGCAEIVARAGLEPARRGLMAGLYRFDDVPAYENVAGPDFPVTRVHWGFDFGVGQWLASYERAGYATTTHARFATAEGTSRTIRLKPGLRLASITIEGPGRYELADGVNPTRRGWLPGAGRPVTVRTWWTAPGEELRLTFSAGQKVVVDDLDAAG